MQRLLKAIFFLFALYAFQGASAQYITGVLTDSVTREPVPHASVTLEGSNTQGELTDSLGRFRLRANKRYGVVQIKALGYAPKQIKVEAGKDANLLLLLSPVDFVLDEAVVRPKKQKYSRKNNPAVELMRKVIAHKKKYRLEDNLFYSYKRYEKMTTSVNDIKKEDLGKGIFQKMPFLIKQIEVCPETEKYILPFSIQEKASTQLYRKIPRKSREIVEGINTEGINELFSTGDILNTVLADVFTNIDIYDNHIRFLQQRFISPISSIEAISFYQYYIADTLVVDNHRCIHLAFVPANPQDFGFTGDLYVLDDTTYQIKRVELRLPYHTNVNFVRSLQVIQDFDKLSTGSWALARNDMLIELYAIKSLPGLQVRQVTRYSDFAFAPIDDRLFNGSGDVVRLDNVMMRDDKFWSEVREVPLTKKETTMTAFVKDLENIPGFKYILFTARALIENFVETGSSKTPSKVDIGPVNTIVGYNSIEGFRTRLSAQTTANLFPQFFLKGYYAYGFRDHRSKGSLRLEYTFNKKEYLPREYPKHSLWASGSYDLETPSDKFLHTDKDNMFLGIKSSDVDQRSYIRRFQLGYERELRNGLSYSASLTHIQDTPAGALLYRRVGDNRLVPDLTSAQASFYIRYCPGESFINTKQRRLTISYDAPAITLSHTVGVKGVLGGDYNFNLTEIGIWKRFWLSSFGRLDIDLKAGKQWDRVPFPLLPVSPTNLSYIIQKGTFSLMNNMEFMNDEYATLFLTYDLNGKLLNRIPFIRRLKLREVVRFNAMWGRLSSKNDPYADGNGDLFHFPSRDGRPTAYAMGSTPYMEISFGIYNIFKLVHVEYVRRLSYLDHADVNKHGIRLAVIMNF